MEENKVNEDKRMFIGTWIFCLLFPIIFFVSITKDFEGIKAMWNYSGWGIFAIILFIIEVIAVSWYGIYKFNKGEVKLI
jgi:hypothetical protein